MGYTILIFHTFPCLVFCDFSKRKRKKTKLLTFQHWQNARLFKLLSHQSIPASQVGNASVFFFQTEGVNR